MKSFATWSARSTPRNLLRTSAGLAAALLLVAACPLSAAPAAAALPAASNAAALPAVSSPAALRLQRLLDGEWEWRLREFPEMATAVGDHRYDDRLTDRSPAAIAARRAHHQDFLASLRAIDRSTLQGEDQRSLDIFLFDADLDVRQDRLLLDGSGATPLPFSATDSPLDVSQMAGPQFDLLDLPRETPFATATDYQRYLSRLHAIPRALAEQRALMEAGRHAGWMLPRVAVERLPGQFAGLLVADPAQHPLLAPFQAMPEAIAPGVAAALRAQGTAVLRDELLPALAGFRDYLAQVWLPAATAGTGVRQLPAGDAWYALQLQRNTTTTMTAQEIHALGRQEVARIQGELAQVLKDAQFSGSIREFREFLLSDPRFQFKTGEAEVSAFRDLSKQIDPQLPTLFAELPRTTYGIRPMHPEEGNNPPHYTPGAIDGSRAGWFEANANNLAGQPTWSIESLFLHEAVPGHHLQIARAQELAGLPSLRRNYGTAAFAEGWALYAESLGYRLGLYRDPYTRFGRLADESLRAARLVVDTGLHQMGWTRAQAIAYLEDYGQQEHGYAEAEIDRYLVWPGQATAYKVGELRIHALRAHAQEVLGARFDLRRFHNAVLDHGALPLTVLDQAIEQWILAEQAGPAKAVTGVPQSTLAAALDSEWAWRLQEFPELATILGDHRHDDRLTDLSAAAVTARRSHHRSFLAAMRAIDPAGLQGEERVSWQIFSEQAELTVQMDALLTASDPSGALPLSADDSPLDINQMGGPQFELPQLVKASRFLTTADYRNYLQRLAGLPRQLADLQARLVAGRTTGWMPPKIALERLPGQFGALLDPDALRNPLLEPFRAFPEGIDAAGGRALRQEAQALVETTVIPAIQSYRDYLAHDWVPSAREATAASALPQGRSYYALALQMANTTRMTPAEIHQLGLTEVARLDGEITAVMRETGFQGTRGEFRQRLRTDLQFQFASAAQELSAYRDLAKRVDARLPALFGELPRLPYGIRAMSPEEGANAPHYVPGALDGTRAGWFEANVNSLAAWPRWSMEALFLHEAVPGHHLQTARALELAGLPAIRRAYFNSGYGEGWALYAEGLGKELGLYQDPYGRYGRLSMEAHRACRLVVDTGLHSLGWTRQQAIDYLIEHGNLEQGFATAEVDRYLVWPGQATAYKVGELQILALRAKARQQLGERFDLRRFHDAVLGHGTLPLTVLEQVIGDWILAEQQQPARAVPSGAP